MFRFYELFQKNKILFLSLICLTIVLLAYVFLAPSQKPKVKVRDGFFGISGIVEDKTYLSDLGVEVYRNGLFLGVSEKIAKEGKPKYEEKIIATINNGAMPIITLYVPRIKDAKLTKETLKKIVYYYTKGKGAKKFGVAIKYWEIGNEVNGNWKTSCDVDEYFNRLKVYASAIKEECPDCVVVMGSLLDSLPGDRDLEPYLTRFLELGGGNYVDVYNFHYYGTSKPVGVGEYYRSGMHIYNSMKNILENYGYGDKHIWVTETSTFSGELNGIVQTEEEQAADLVKRFVTMKALGVQKVFWCFVEEPDYEGGTDEGFFDQSGLVYDGKGKYDKGKGVKKKAYYAYKELVKRLGNNSTVVKVQDDGETYLAVFSKNESKISVIWHDYWFGEKSVKIKGTGKLTAYSIYGNKIGEGLNSITLNLSIEPVYVEGDVKGYSYLKKISSPLEKV